MTYEQSAYTYLMKNSWLLICENGCFFAKFIEGRCDAIVCFNFIRAVKYTVPVARDFPAGYQSRQTSGSIYYA